MTSDSGIPPHGVRAKRTLKNKVGILQLLGIGIFSSGLAVVALITTPELPIIELTALAGVTLFCIAGVAIFRDAVTVAEKTDWATIPVWWGIVSTLFPVFGGALYLRFRNQAVAKSRKHHFGNVCDDYARELTALEDQMQPYLRVKAYLTYHHHKEFEGRFAQLHKQFQRLQEDVAATEFLAADNDRLSEFASRLEMLQDVLEDREAYNDEFVEQELSRCQEFFAAIGDEGYSLNRKQREAVVRNDTYNRVIAGAGTGKTLVLTTRVAYLVQYQNVQPEEILVSTFTNKAADEMEERLRTDFGITGVEITTLHGFGYDVIAQNRLGQPDVFNEDDRHHFIRDVLDRQIEHFPETFYDHFAEFLLYSELPDITEADFETRAEFVARLERESYTTLRGESVKSRAEKLIADFLHTHQIEYRYERRAEEINARFDSDRSTKSRFDERGEAYVEDDTKGAYRPDFYIPAADVYIEHFGIDESGTVAEWFSTSSEEYIEKIHWAREQFAKVDAFLIETYQFEFDTGRLRKALQHRLNLHNVTAERLPHKELVNETYEIHEQDVPLWEEFGRFIELARTFRIRPDQIPPRLSRTKPEQYHFGMCGGLLLYAYEERLEETNSIDFQDMIHQAAHSLEERAKTSYEHVLVDEFQDLGRDQLKLIEVLSGPEAGRLFAVGDDWQSIYSFQGAIVDLFIDFEDHFGPTATSVLEVNYRSPAQIVDAGAALIAKNDQQLDKPITANSDVEGTVVTHRLGGYRRWDHIEYTAELTVYLIRAYLKRGCDPGDIMVLCRYDDAVEHLAVIRQLLEENAIPHGDSKDGAPPGSEMYDGTVTVEAVHQIKGMEADHVIVTHVTEEGMGFPATDRNTERLDPVREVEMNTMAEERRLFYVALTRCIRTVDLITKQGAESRFIKEIDDFVDQAIDASELVNVDENSDIDILDAKVAHLWEDTHPKKHQDGILEDHTDSIRFVSWASSNPPTLEEETWYRFDGIRVNEYKDKPQVVVSGATETTEIEPEDARVNIEDLHEHLVGDPELSHLE